MSHYEALKCNLLLHNNLIINYPRNLLELMHLHYKFFLPSYNEPASISILEAMSYGLPAICHSSCGTKTYIEDGYNGFILEEISQSSLEAIILKLLENEKLLTTLSKNCISYHSLNFSEDRYYEHFKRIINSFKNLKI